MLKLSELTRQMSAMLWLILQCMLAAHQTRALTVSDVTAETYAEYYNYVDLTHRLQSLSRKHARISSLSSIGRSAEDRELWVMRVTADLGADVPGKPRVKYVGNIHGDEALSRQVLVYLIEYLLTRYDRDMRVTELVNRTDIYIMPSMNPDGFERAEQGDCTGTSEARQNAKHYDLDNSFTHQPSGTTLNDIPEVTAVMKWILEKK